MRKDWCALLVSVALAFWLFDRIVWRLWVHCDGRVALTAYFAGHEDPAACPPPLDLTATEALELLCDPRSRAVLTTEVDGAPLMSACDEWLASTPGLLFPNARPSLDPWGRPWAGPSSLSIQRAAYSAGPNGLYENGSGDDVQLLSSNEIALASVAFTVLRGLGLALVAGFASAFMAPHARSFVASAVIVVTSSVIALACLRDRWDVTMVDQFACSGLNFKGSVALSVAFFVALVVVAARLLLLHALFVDGGQRSEVSYGDDH